MKISVSVRMKEVMPGRIIDEENDYDNNVEGDVVEGPILCVGR